MADKQMKTFNTGTTRYIITDAQAREDIAELQDQVAPLDVSAQSGDVGKALKAKTVANGKVTEYELGEAAIIDDTLSVAGEAADAKETGDAIADLDAAKVNKPTTSPNGTSGQLLRTNGDGTTTWVDQGLPTDAQTADAVSAWLDDHPEATTTVQDGAITKAKLDSNLQGTVDDVDDLKSQVEEISNPPSIAGTSDTGADLDITDDDGNVLIRLAGGNIQTKNFNSDDGVYESRFAYTNTAGTETIDHFFPAGTRLVFHLTNYADRGGDTIANSAVTYKYTDANGTQHTICSDYGYNFPEYTLPEDAFAVSVTYGTGLNWGNDTTLSFKVYSVVSYERQPTILTVAPSGKQYTSLRAALEYAKQTADAYNRFEIHVYPGTYDTLSYFTDDEIAADGFKGLFVTNGISLIGIGQGAEIILTATMSASDYTESKRNDVSTLNIEGNVTIKNVTIKAENIRYAVHDDNGIMSNQQDVHVFEEVTMYGTNLTSGGGGNRSYGAGGANSKRLYFKNCDFSDAMVIHTAANMVHEYTAYLENCRARYMAFSDYNSGIKAHFYLKNCVVSRISIGQSGGSHDQFIQLEGEGVRDAMILCPTGYVYALDGVHKFYGANIVAGKAVKLNATMVSVETSNALNTVYGISIGVANGATYVQTEGWINSNILGLTGLSVGDYLTVNTSTGAVEIGTAENAIAQVRYVDSNSVAYAKLMI